MKSFLEWSNKINENSINQMSIDQIVTAGPSVMADAAATLLMWLNIGIEDKEKFPHPLEARRLKIEIDAFLGNYPKITSQKTPQNHPYPVGDRMVNPSED
jgi:hypothetical protein